jgi:hypothetical protein
MSVDPLEAITGEPYSYAEDDPLNAWDPSGSSIWSFAEHVVLGTAEFGDAGLTAVVTAVATPVCFAAVSVAPVIGQVAGYPACTVFAVGDTLWTAYQYFDGFEQFKEAFNEVFGSAEHSRVPCGPTGVSGSAQVGNPSTKTPYEG